MTNLRRPSLPMGLSTLMMACLSLSAQAQTYTAKVLKPPANSLQSSQTANCYKADAHLSDSGDVVTNCEFRSVNALTIFAILAGAGNIETKLKAVVWRAGGAPTVLNGTLSNTAFAVGITPEGHVLGEAGPTSIWKGSTRSNWPLPTELKSAKWWMRGVSDGGRAVLMAKETTEPLSNRLATVVAGKGTVLPVPPADCQGDAEWAINEAGHVMLVNSVKQTSSDGYYQIYAAKACLWNGQQWTVSATLPSQYDPADDYRHGYYPYEVLSLNSKDEALIKPRSDKLLVWSPTRGIVAPPPQSLAYGRNDEWLGGANPAQHQPTAHASVWRNGAAVDLNTVTDLSGLPAGTVITSTLKSNSKGQLLVIATPPTATSASAAWLVLLSPR
jgi:hypothetical protein